MSLPDDSTGPAPVRFVGRFRIVRPLGRGGMGEVYLAEDPELGRLVALKVLAAGVTHDPDRRAFFKREATSAAALNHPNICTIFEVGEADDQPFIAMEAIEGRTLRDRLAAGPLAVPEALAIALQIAAALEHAQTRHVVHRDLKSANIMLTPDGGVKVLDFGLAKRVLPADTAIGRATEWVSRDDVVFGTLPYMSPEQALGRAVDHRSDLFSFGTVLYEALSGTLPFDGATRPELLNAIVNVEPVPLTQSPALSMVIGKLLAKDPADRYQSARDVSHDLRAIQESGDLTRRRTAISRRRAALTAVAAAVLIAILSGAAWWRSHRITVSGTDASLVVVPAVVTGPAQFQFLADAVPNSLTTRLSQHAGIKMKVPPTSIEFANVSGNLARVAESYGVTVCVVPRVAVASGRVTVNVQVVVAKGRDIFWSGEFAGPLDRYADAVKEAADGIALAVTGQRPPARAASGPPPNSALELALGRGEYYGRHFNQKYQPADLELARSAYQEALQIDPRSAAAAAGLAYLEIYQLQGGAPPQDRLPVLERWARQATEFDPNYAMGWAALVNADRWRPTAELSRLLEYGFRAASLDESCGRCQLALMPALTPLSMVLKHHNAQYAAELDPLSGIAQLNSVTALIALGRADEASATMARSQAIEPETLWVLVHKVFVDAGSGSLAAAAAEGEALRAQDRLKTLPGWVASIFDLTRAMAGGNRADIARSVERLRDPIRQRRASILEMQYVTAVAVTMLARGGYSDAVLDILADVTAADAPPAYDMVVMNPFLKGLMASPRGRDIVAQARARFDVLLNAIAAAKSAGRMPRYLERPLQDLLLSLRDAGRPG